MSSTDKRRGTSHTTRSSASSRTTNIIAPPPRAQLTHAVSPSSSPGPEKDSVHESANPAGKDAGAALAAKERESILLREKDSKIAELKRELAVMETEFSKELSRLSQKESETASFWQARHSNLNQQFLRVDAELRLLRNEVDVKEAERIELREGWECLQREVKERDDEIRSLKGHLSGLKQWVSASTKRGDQISDEEIGDSMANLRNSLQNWVVSHFRKASFDLTKATQAVVDDLSALVPMYEELAVSETKPHLLQSIVSSILVEMIFGAYFVGLPGENAAQLSQVEKYLASLASTEAVNQWRATMLTLIQKEALPKLQDETAATTEKVISRINQILNSITDAAATSARDQALRVLVNNSITLARSLVVQKAAFEVTMPKILPHQRILFDPATMDDIGEEDEESLTAREIQCVTFPGVIKTGDENGSHPHFRNVIAKARVLCGPEE
ncbi:hypothetical protein F4775DRAFT_358320 [Biscogniauxia sp. FL1348]|nr:hypothetical protein F4775DRAFT_358320 [Biscogniauxia sp. FL1348]